jgi:hypothetical protein
VAITKIVADDISLGEGALGQLDAAGPEDIRLPLKQFLGSRTHTLARARMEISIFDEQVRIEVTKSGIISSPNHLGAKTRELLRQNVAGLEHRRL